MKGRFWIGLLAFAGALTVGLPPVADGVSPVLGLGLGASAGAVLYLTLVRRLPRRPALRLVPLLGYLTGCAILEELVWRGYLFGGLLRALHPAGALAASSLAFAAVHGRPAPHVLTGATFGAVYLGTGRLGAACAAHALYNWLVALSARGSPQVRAAWDSALPAELRGVSRAFGATQALRGVDLALHDGQVLALLGANGAGKSTAMAILLGLRSADEGEARLAGLDPRLPEARRSVGCVPQELGFPPTMRVGELVDLVRAHYLHPRPREELLRRFAIAALERRQTGGLSGGEKRRLGVALAFAGAPRTLFLDEPTAGLDPESRRLLWEEVRLHVAAGGSVLLTTHYLEEADALANEVVVLDRGRVVATGTPAELRASIGLAAVRVQATELPPLAAAESIERLPGGSLVLTADVGAVVAELVESGVDLAGLEIAPPSLEQALQRLSSPGRSR